MPRFAVSRVADHSRLDSGLRLECVPEAASPSPTRKEVRTVPVEIRFDAPDVFRFELHATPETPDRGSGIRYDEDAVAEPVDLDVTVADGSLTAATSALTVEVGLDDWTFAVYDDDGRRLLREQRRAHNAKGEDLSTPLGFTEERVNGWPHRVSGTGTAFGLRPGERVYGLGERFAGFEHRGTSVDAWVTQPNGTESRAAYKNVPFYLSTAGYGLLVDTCRRVSFDFGEATPSTARVSTEDDSLRFVFFGGPSFKRIVRRYTALTGRPHRPERWTFGVWMSRLTYESRAELESVATTLRDRGMPCDVLHLDPGWMGFDSLCDLRWDTEAFPAPDEMIDSLHDAGFHLSVWEYPYVTTDSDLFDEFAAAGFFVSDGSGDPYLLSRLSADDRGAIVDFTNPDAAAWWAARHRELADTGVDAFKLDFGEYLPRDAVLSDGRGGGAVRNRYPHHYYGTVQRALRDAGRDRPTLWVRSGWIGDQTYPIHWGGDPNSTFESMAASLRGGLSLALSGYQFWSADIGGFDGEPSPELYVRWAQWSLLGTSHARFHGTTPREPWHYGEEAARIVREYARERYRLLPYIYSCAERASRTGLPVLRPLVLEYQDDPAARGADTQHLLGRNLLVAPLLDEGGRREVYLPAGEWVDYWTGDRYDGGTTLRVDVDLDTLPLFVRAGAILPTQPAAVRTDETVGSPLGLRAELPSDGGQAAVHDADDPDSGAVRPRSDQPAAGGERRASAEFYDHVADRSVTVTAAYDPGSRSVELDAPVERELGTATVRGVPARPTAVEANDARLTAVGEDPDAGEWTFDESTATVRANLPG